MIRGAVYFSIVFGVGFVLGVVRVTLLVPRLGERWAELAEMPLMLLAIFVAARFVVRRFPAPRRVGYLASGGVALLALLLVEFSVVLGLRGLSISRYLAERDPVAGSVYVLMLVLFAAMPWLLGRDVRAGRTIARLILAVGITGSMATLVACGDATDPETESAARVAPSSVTERSRAANQLEQEGEIVLAAGRYEDLVESFPDSAEAHLELAGFLDRAGELDAARSAYERTLELDPSHARASDRLGAVLERQGDVDAAERAYRRATELDPAFADAWFNRADLALASDATENAVECYATGLALEPDRTAARLNHAVGLAMLDRTDEAVDEFRQVLDAEPENAKALHNLAWILATSDEPGIRDPQQAHEYATRANDATGRTDPDALEALAVACAASGRPQEARDAAALAIEAARRRGGSDVAAQFEARLRSLGVIR